MRRRRVEQAIGETICHDMTSIQDGIKSVAFKRGHVIVESDIPILKRMGKSHIYVWDPNPDEIHEDEAGLAGAKALTGPGLVYDGPREGRYTITAAHDGLFTVNRAALRAFNAVPDYTAATRPNHSPVKEGEVVAGIRIVPLVTARENVERVEAMTQILTLRPFAPLRTGIIITGNEVYDGLIQDCFEPVLRDKLAPYGAEILSVTKCPDDQGAIVTAAEDFLAQGAELLLFTGGMSVDPDDRTPSAIRATGAEVIVQGIPVQPGNMLMLAYRGKTALIGVPTAAMGGRITSLDIVLPRVFAGDELTPEDFANLGEGGLCATCERCTYPICYFGRPL